MAVRHFPSTQSKYCFATSVLLSAVHMTAQVTQLLCCLYISQTLPHMMGRLCIQLNKNKHLTLLYIWGYSCCSSLKAFSLRMMGRPSHISAFVGPWVEISQGFMVRLRAAAHDDDDDCVYLAGFPGIAKHSVLPLVGSSNCHIVKSSRIQMHSFACCWFAYQR